MKVYINEKVILTTLVVTCFVAAFIPGVMSVAYTRFGETLFSAIIYNGLAAILLTLPTVIAASLLGTASTRFVATISFLYALYRLVLSYNPDIHFGFTEKAVIVLVALSLSFLCLRYLRNSTWINIAFVLLIGFVVWILSLFVISWFQSDSKTYTTLSLDRLLKTTPESAVFLVLDELSPEFAGEIMSVLVSPGHTLHSGVIQKAGRSTINAIPSMLTPYRHDDVTACGAERLCGPRAFDIRNLVAVNDNTDLVGFYHPYCGIRNLRTCSVASASQKDSPANFFFDVVRVLEQLPIINRLIYSDKRAEYADYANQALFSYVRNYVTNYSLNAPFWKIGGFLYIHHLIPHPSGGSGFFKKSLREEYAANIVIARDFVEILNNKLQERFGKNYVFIVTTDHPLRTEMWCKSNGYASASCTDENPQEAELIPFLVLAPTGTEVELPNTAVGLLSPAN